MSLFVFETVFKNNLIKRINEGYK